jgi:GntR family transcriptional regulator
VTADKTKTLGTLDLTGVIPLHHQIKEDLALQIRSGRWRPEEEIPSEANLCRHYGVSRGTVRQAIADLVQQGLIHRRQGRGSFVSKAKLEGSVLGSYHLYRKDAALDHRSQVIRCRLWSPSSDIRRILGTNRGEKVYQLERVRFVQKIPISLQISYLPARLCPGLEAKDLSGEALYNVLEREYGVSFLRAEESIEPVLADEYVAGHLHIAVGSPVFLVERSSYTFNNHMGEFRRAHMRGDLYRYRIDLR